MHKINTNWMTQHNNNNNNILHTDIHYPPNMTVKSINKIYKDYKIMSRYRIIVT